MPSGPTRTNAEWQIIMNPLAWKRDHQIALACAVIVGGVIGLIVGLYATPSYVPFRWAPYGAAAEKVLERLATSDKTTIVIERQPDGKMRVT
jgi:hypothetical protein